MMFWNGGLGAWGWVAMATGMVLFWTLVVVGIVWLVRSTGGSGYREAATADPQQLLASRFARGEIDEREYRERLAVLRGQGPGSSR